MNIVFMGTPAFAVPSLRALAREHDILVVYTRPDAVSGRGSKRRPSEVKVAALELGIDVEEPRTLRDPDVVEHLRRLAPDLIVVAAYGMIIPDEVLEIPPLGAINVHGSLLPAWRGAAPIERAILAGDERIGVTIMRVVSELDAGDYAGSVSVDAGEKSAEELREELAILGAEALVQIVRAVEDDEVVWTVQDQELVTYADKIEKGEVALSPELTTVDALRRIRASSRHAPARFSLGEVGATALAATVDRAPDTPASGSFRARKHGVSLGLADGAVLLTDVKPDGKAAMAAGDWLRGRRLDQGEWGAER